MGCTHSKHSKTDAKSPTEKVLPVFEGSITVSLDSDGSEKKCGDDSCATLISPSMSYYSDTEMSLRDVLIPAKFTSVDDALQMFSVAFEAKYDSIGPGFFTQTLESALVCAFGSLKSGVPGSRPLALYIHHSGSLFHEVFARHVICNNNVSEVLRKQYVTWGWDVTCYENKKLLNEWLETLKLDAVIDAIQDIIENRYPLLVLVVKDRGWYRVADIIRGSGSEEPDAAESATRTLLTVVDCFLGIQQRSIDEERARTERATLRVEQQEAYDRAAAEEIRRRKEREAEEEARLRNEREAEKMRNALSLLLPAEPPADEKDIIAIRLRFPSGEMKERRFRMSDELRWLGIYCDSIGYDSQHYQFFTSDVPKKDLGCLDRKKSFADLKWTSREHIRR